MRKFVKSLVVTLLMLSPAWAETEIAIQERTESRSDVATTQRRMDFIFPNSDMRTVFAALSEHAGVDLIPAPNITGKIALQVRNKTWQEVLDIICNLYDLTWVIEDKYIHVMRRADFDRRRSEINGKDRRELTEAPKVRKTFTLQHAKAQDLLPVISQIVAEYTGSATVVERSNAMVVNASPPVLDLVAKAIKDLDVATRQVVITARLVVVDSKILQEIGVDWNLASGVGNLPKAGDGLQGSGGLPTRGVLDSRSQVEMRINPAGTPGISTANGSISMGVFQGNVGVALNQFLKDDKTELLASPQVTTLDHQAASINMTENITVRVIDERGVPGIQQMTAGVKLDVIPHITGEGRVLLELQPENSSFSVDAQGQPVKQEQKAKTNVVIDDGETVVIAGLTTNQQINVEAGIPFLKDIPLVGNLFKHTRKDYSKKDLIIFVTPNVIKNKEDDFLYTDALPTAPVAPSGITATQGTAVGGVATPVAGATNPTP